MSIEIKILNFLIANNLTNSCKTFVIGFSGGQDSLCLMDVLNKLSKDHGFKIVAAHLNHNWRGEDSENEQISCMEFCNTKGIEFYTKTLDVPEKISEEIAREERYKFFEEITLKTSSEGVFTAHTKTDNTETVLYRIIKGTGVFGVCGIPAIRREKNYTIYRPMLDITREETGLYCNENALVPTCDRSNFDDKYARNNLRLNIIPKIKEINPNFDESLENLSKIACDYENILSAFLPETLDPYVFDLFDKPVQKSIVHRFLMQNQIDYSYKKIEEIIAFILESLDKPCGNTISLTTDKWLFVSSKKIELIDKIKAAKIDEVIELKFNQENYFAPMDKTFIIKDYKGEKPFIFPPEKSTKAFVNIPKSLAPIELRTRREGDIIQPFGLSGTMKLKKYFINKAIPEHTRDEILLLTCQNEVLWAIGVGLSEKLRAGEIPQYTIELR